MVWWWVRELFPLSGDSDPQRFVQKVEADPVYVANTGMLRKELAGLARPSADLVHTFATGCQAAEQSRGDSINSRGQGVLVAQAFLSALMPLGSTALSSHNALMRWHAWVTGGVALYLAVQAVLLTISALRAVRPVDYPTISSSELLKMLPKEDNIVQQTSLQTMLNYRTSNLLNTWRFGHLILAQKALRNTTISLIVLMGLVFWFSVTADPPTAGHP